MRSKYYIITAYDMVNEKRTLVCETDWGVIAWFNWWKFRLLNRYNYTIMTVSV